MTSFIEVLEAFGSFIVGLAGRGALFLVGALALALPALAVALAWRAVERGRRSALAFAGTTSYRRGAYYAPNHTWLAPSGRGDVEVGLDDLAQRLLPSATSVELPRPGMEVHRGDPIAIVRAGARTLRVGAPVDGTVRRVNARVRRDPDLVKREPYGRGWLFALAPAERDYRRLPQGNDADGWFRSEHDRLERLVEDALGYAAADGGDLIGPAPRLLTEDRWRRLVDTFLRVA